MLQNNKNKIITVVGVVLAIIAVIIISIFFYKNRKINVSKYTPAIIVEDKVNFYKKPKSQNVKIYKEVELGKHAHIIKGIKNKNNEKFYKVVLDNKIGYVKEKEIGYYKKSNDDKQLMLDVSKFNKKNNFKNGNEFAAFVAKNDFTAVYIRAGGRGYGKEGNFYTDKEAKIWAEECEFLKIPFGYYFLDEALNDKEIKEEVNFILNYLNNNKYENLKLPVALDIEEHDGKTRASNIWENRGVLVTRLIKELKRKGIDSIVYTNAKTADKYLSNVPTKFWLAYYPKLNGKLPSVWIDKSKSVAADNKKLMKKTIAWQFSDTGIKGIINEKVDLSLVKKEFIKKF